MAGQSFAENFNPGVVSIDGAVFLCPLSLDKVQDDLESGGRHREQWLHVTIPKTLLAVQPADSTEITHEGKTFLVKRVGGVESYAVAWDIDARRIVRAGDVDV